MASKFLAGITQPHGASATPFLKPIAALLSYLSPSKYRKENSSDTPGVYQGEGRAARTVALQYIRPGFVLRICFAVFRLIISWNLVGCSSRSGFVGRRGRFRGR
jgi:hypothetical protein